ncbi:hypothetical protein TNCV_4199981 [Trichonephila clavipes]|uniref:Uncharacterized protein n=1 Tax=Trichonephila clavipes TaxID=2585209 RepID=A0A8X6WB05_TRICX|nr:hypothetical protein TNCV_4199981 [Trichonephila clavipes]
MPQNINICTGSLLGIERRHRRTTTPQLARDHAAVSGRTTRPTVLQRLAFRERDIRHMDWPSKSVVLNPIEHIWDGLGKAIS